MIGSRLHGRIYLAVLASVVTVSILAGAVWHLTGGDESVAAGLDAASRIAEELLPPPAADPRDAEAVLVRWHRQLDVSLALFSPAGEPIASAGAPLPAPDPSRAESRVIHVRTRAAAVLRLPDGRWLVVSRGGARRLVHLGFLWLLALSAVAVALVAYPISRRLTRRLEALQESVEALGAGDLSARVPVRGHDEVASLAASFNRSAERIEAAVGAQRRLLANTSHELRSPLARLEVAASLLQGEQRLKDEISRDVAELDGLLEELLLASRLEAGVSGDPLESVDLTALVAEECARADAAFGGDLVTLGGSPRLLRRLVRNLLENARRHGGGGVDATLRRLPSGGAELEVLDRGPGVPEELRERIFEPFFRLPETPASRLPGDGTAPGNVPRSGPPDGVGLGLSLARQVARRHGGDVVCLPREGGGSLFRATLGVTAPP